MLFLNEGRMYRCSVCVLLVIFLQLVKGSPPPVYVSNVTHILSYTRDRPQVDVVLGQDGYRIVGIAVDLLRNHMFWSDTSQKFYGIYRSDLNGNNITVITKDVGEVYGLSVDWVSRHLYWTDKARGIVEVANYDGSGRKILVSSDLKSPQAILADPIVGFLFWVNHDPQRIERSLLDGSRRRTIYKDSSILPNQLAVSHKTKLLYWVDAKVRAIFSCKLNGKECKRQVNYKRIARGSPGFGLVVYGNTAVVSTWMNTAIYSMLLESKKLIWHQETKNLGHRELYSMVSLNRATQPMTFHPCMEDDRAGCSHLCLPAGRKEEITCTCPTYGGLAMYTDKCSQGPSTTTCTVPCEVLLFTSEDTGDVGFISPDTTVAKEVHLISKSSSPSALTYDPAEKMVYWSDTTEKAIYSARFDGNEKLVFLNGNHGIGLVNSLAFSELTASLYFTNAGNYEVDGTRHSWHRVEMVSVHSGDRMTILQDLNYPVAIVVDSEYLYTLDAGRSPRILRTELDGSNPVTLSDVPLVKPFGLDLFENSLYVADYQNSTTITVLQYNLLTKTLDETDITWKERATSFTKVPSGAYFTDSEEGHIVAFNGTSTHSVLSNRKSSGVKYVLTSTAVDEKHDHISECIFFGCSHGCVPLPKGSVSKYRCTCPDHNMMVLSSNGKTCAKPENFLLYTSASTINLLSLDEGTSSRPVTLLYGNSSSSFTGLQYDTLKERIFWIDTTRNEIYLSNLHRLEPMLVYQEKGTINSLVVDFSEQKLYWAGNLLNTANPGFIAIFPLKRRRKYYRTYNDMNWTKSLTLSPDGKWLYWVESTPGVLGAKICTMNVKEHHIVREVLTGSLYWPSSMLVTNDKIYIADRNGKIKVYTFEVEKPRMKAEYVLEEVYATPSQLSGWQLHESLLVYSKWNSSAIYMADILTMTTVPLATNITQPTSMVLHHPSNISDVCIHGNGSECTTTCSSFVRELYLRQEDLNSECILFGCSHGCVPLPKGSESKYRCTCPHKMMFLTGKTCVKPENFLLYTSNSTINLLNLDERTSSKPVALLYGNSNSSFTGLQYDSVKERIFWVDTTRNEIYLSNLDKLEPKLVHQGNGTINSLVVDFSREKVYWSGNQLNSAHTGFIARLQLERSANRRYKWPINRNWPKSLTLSPDGTWLYWVESGTTIFTCRFNGNNARKVLDEYGLNRPSSLLATNDKIYIAQSDGKIRVHTFAVGNSLNDVYAAPSQLSGWQLHESLLFFSEWNSSAIYMADILTMATIPLATNITQPTSMVLHHPGNISDMCNHGNGSQCTTICTSFVRGLYHCKGEIPPETDKTIFKEDLVEDGSGNVELPSTRKQIIEGNSTPTAKIDNRITNEASVENGIGNVELPSTRKQVIDLGSPTPTVEIDNTIYKEDLVEDGSGNVELPSTRKQISEGSPTPTSEIDKIVYKEDLVEEGSARIEPLESSTEYYDFGDYYMKHSLGYYHYYGNYDTTDTPEVGESKSNTFSTTPATTHVKDYAEPKPTPSTRKQVIEGSPAPTAEINNTIYKEDLVEDGSGNVELPSTRKQVIEGSPTPPAKIDDRIYKEDLVEEGSVRIEPLDFPRFENCPSSPVQADIPATSSKVEVQVLPTGYDNSGIVLPLHSNYEMTEHGVLVQWKGKEKDSSHHVMFKVTDSNLMESKCEFDVILKDVDPPKFTYCPSNIKVGTNVASENVNWDDPEAVDNVGIRLISGTYADHRHFPAGESVVNYTAEDFAGNKAFCTFRVTVIHDKLCNLPEISHGGIVCLHGDKTDGDCSVICETGYVVNPIRTFRRTFNCMHPDDIDALTTLMRTQQPCLNRRYPSVIQQEFRLLFHGPINKHQEEVISFLSVAISEHLEKKKLCTQGVCQIGNLTIPCELEREIEGKNQSCFENIEREKFFITFNVTLMNTTSPAELDMNRLLKDIHMELMSLSSLLQLQLEDQLFMAISDSLSTTDITWSCPLGQISENNICIACPPGTLHNVTLDICQYCNMGQYQDKEGQVTCNICDPGQTSPDGATTPSQCHTIPSMDEMTLFVIVTACSFGVVFLCMAITLYLQFQRQQKRNQKASSQKKTRYNMSPNIYVAPPPILKSKLDENLSPGQRTYSIDKKHPINIYNNHDYEDPDRSPNSGPQSVFQNEMFHGSPGQVRRSTREYSPMEEVPTGTLSRENTFNNSTYSPLFSVRRSERGSQKGSPIAQRKMSHDSTFSSYSPGMMRNQGTPTSDTPLITQSPLLRLKLAAYNLNHED